MDVDEIIIYRVQRDRMRMVLDFLQQKAGARNLDKEIGHWECLEYGKVASVFINKTEETV